MNSLNYFDDLLKEHLRQPFRAAFAYGSGVFRQENNYYGHTETTAKVSSKMVDFLVIIGDEDADSWHRRNMQLNPNDYPLLGRLALKHTNLFTDSVYFVPNVRVRDRSIKYGVIRESAFIRDLFTWDQLYVAGRLHKPTLKLSVKESDNCSESTLNSAIEYNLDSAMRAALLCNPFPSDFRTILKTIVGLSYTGDPRKLLTESPH
ncbi:hypothetical protein EBR57_10855, partial [bacterium]|nr:hypothetical protein [bacterium]